MGDSTMKTLRLVFAAVILSFLTEMPVPDGAYGPKYDVPQAADVPTFVRGY
jgi:hypothetical protein